MPWYDPDWDYRVKITTDPTAIPSNQTDFPVHVDLAQLGSGHAFWGNVKSDGGDLRATKSDGTTEVAMELVFIDTTAKTGVVYFTSDGTLDSVTADDFYLYYGNAAVSLPAATATYGSQNVWDSNFNCVHHMSGAAYTDLDDSTSNGNDVSAEGGNPMYDQSGPGGQRAVDFDGTGDYLTIPHANSLSPASVQNFTVEAWAYTDTLQSLAIVTKSRRTTGYEFWLRNNSIGNFQFYAWQSVGSTYERQYKVSGGTGVWEYFVGTITNAHLTTKDVNLFIDADDTGLTHTEDTNAMSTVSGANVEIGRRNRAGTGDEWNFDGKISEIRISGVVRSDDWVTTTNNSISDSAFLTYGAEESNVSSPPAAAPCQAVLVML